MACQVEKIRTRFGQRVVLVGELTAAGPGGRGRPALDHHDDPQTAGRRTVTPSLFDERDLAVTSEAFPGERLIVCRNPLLAAQRQRKRQELLAATEEDLAPIAAATTRKNRPLRGAAEIGLRVGKVINRHKVAKRDHDHRRTFTPPGRRIATEQQLDGLYIVRERRAGAVRRGAGCGPDLSKVERGFGA